MPDGWRPQVRTRGLAQDDSRETVAVLHDGSAGPDVWTCRCPGCSTWNPQAMLGSLPPRFETSVLTRMGRLRPSPAADARRGRTRNPTRSPLGPRRRFAAASTDPGCGSVHRPRMGGCFTWNRRQCPGSRRPSSTGRRAGCHEGTALSHEGTVRCSTALVLGDFGRPQATRIHVESGRSSTPGAGQILVLGRARCFTWNRRRCSGGGTAPSASNARTGCLMRDCGRPRGADVRRLGCPEPKRFHVELRRCSTVGATDSDAWTGWMFHVEPGGQCLVDGASRLGRQNRMTD